MLEPRQACVVGGDSKQREQLQVRSESLSGNTVKNLMFNGTVGTLLSGKRGPLNSLGFHRKTAEVNAGG